MWKSPGSTGSEGLKESQNTTKACRYVARLVYLKRGFERPRVMVKPQLKEKSQDGRGPV